MKTSSFNDRRRKRDQDVPEGPCGSSRCEGFHATFPGVLTFVVGPSGSGKSSLLYILGAPINPPAAK